MRSDHISRRGLLAFAVLAASAGSVPAAGLDAPREKAILTIGGKISAANEAGVAVFDRAMLEGFGTVSFVTTTPWFSRPVAFEGVPMSRLMEAVGATGDHIIAVGLDDYSIELPIDDFAKYGVILALKRDGEYMAVRNNGPLFIIYPFDSDPKLKRQTYYSRSVWQVKRLDVR